MKFDDSWFSSRCNESDTFVLRHIFCSPKLKAQFGFFALSQHYDLIISLLKCVYWFELVSQVSDVANWPVPIPWIDYSDRFLSHQGHFQPNLSQFIINGLWGFKFAQMKGHAFFPKRIEWQILKIGKIITLATFQNYSLSKFQTSLAPSLPF